MENYVTPELQALIGKEFSMDAWDAVERSAIRRFVQAVMDPDPVYWDDAAGVERGYGGTVAPPMFPFYGFRCPPNYPDPLNEAIKDAHFHGSSFLPRFGLPEPPIPLKRLLNGGNDLEFIADARAGDRLRAKSKIEDIYQREGRSGPLVFVKMNITISNQDGQVLMINRQTEIRR